MDRRHFLLAGGAGALGSAGLADSAAARLGPGGLDPVRRAGRGHEPARPTTPEEWRAAFPRLRRHTFLDAAGGTPLGDFAEAGLQGYLDWIRFGEDRSPLVNVLESVRSDFGALVGARESEIALAHCTKAGEQVVIDALDPIGTGRNVVTNDMHFSGSLHNLIGLRRAGADVRIVGGVGWERTLESMSEAIDDSTALVTLTLVSNVTGRIEPIREVADMAHARGALVFADIIQAAGVLPLDLSELGVDCAACSSYKWLFGVHGAGFLYVRDEVQGAVLPDRLFPGHVQYGYSPWIRQPDPEAEPWTYTPPSDATRYQPGHVSYLGYAGLLESLRALRETGLHVIRDHCLALGEQLVLGLDPDRYPLVSPDPDRSPVYAFEVPDPDGLAATLERERVFAPVRDGRVRVSPGIYNDASDVARLVELMNGL